MFGQSTQSTQVVDVGVHGGLRKGSCHGSLTRWVVRNPQFIEVACPRTDHPPRDTFHHGRHGNLELMSHQDTGNPWRRSPVAVVRHNGLDGVVTNELLCPAAFVCDVSHEGGHLACNGQQVASLGILHVHAWLDVKCQTVCIVESGLQPLQGRALGGDVHVPPFCHGMFNQRQGPRGVPHAPIEDGNQQLRTVVRGTHLTMKFLISRQL